MSSANEEAAAFRRRRFVFAAAVLATALTALVVMARVLGAGGLDVAGFVLLACFAAMLPWNVIGFWNAVVGFAILCFSRDAVAHVLPAVRSPSVDPIKARVALVMPVHNEDPSRVIRHLQETSRQSRSDGRGGRVRGIPAQRHPDSSHRGGRGRSIRANARQSRRAPIDCTIGAGSPIMDTRPAISGNSWSVRVAASITCSYWTPTA